MKLKPNYIGTPTGEKDTAGTSVYISDGNTIFPPGTLYSYQFYCPGCKTLHSYIVTSWTDLNNNPHNGWTFDGNLQLPSFTPSLLLYYTHPFTNQRISICHVVLTHGILNFCTDCEHELKGQSVPLPHIPDCKECGGSGDNQYGEGDCQYCKGVGLIST